MTPERVLWSEGQINLCPAAGHRGDPQVTLGLNTNAPQVVAGGSSIVLVTLS